MLISTSARETETHEANRGFIFDNWIINLS